MRGYEVDLIINNMENNKYYPFDEGDTYYTVEDGQIVESLGIM